MREKKTFLDALYQHAPSCSTCKNAIDSFVEREIPRSPKEKRHHLRFLFRHLKQAHGLTESGVVFLRFLSLFFFLGLFSGYLSVHHLLWVTPIITAIGAVIGTFTESYLAKKGRILH